MAGFQKKDGGLMDVIRCDEEDYLIWKWHPKGTLLKDSQRANAIRWGSSLNVKPGSVAVFMYPQPDGTIEDYIEGPADIILKTENLPVLSGLIGVLYDGGSPFQAEVYYINLKGVLQVPFGVPKFNAFDPQYDNYGVPIMVRGTISFSISDYKEFVKKYGLENYNLQDFKNQIRDTVTGTVKSVVINTPERRGVSVIQIEKEIDYINRTASDNIEGLLHDAFGISLVRLDISDIEVDSTSEGYQKLNRINQSKLHEVIHTTQSVFDSLSSQKAGAKRIKEAKKERLSAEKKENQPGVLKGVFNAGQGALKAGINAVKQATKNAPPPLPEYHVVVKGEQKGPLNTFQLKEMLQRCEIDSETLVWTTGMKEWEKMGEKLPQLFENPTPSSLPDESMSSE